MAFLGEDSWKSGLNPQTLNKITILEKHRDGLKSELAKKSYNFDIMSQALEKEKRKVNTRLELARKIWIRAGNLLFSNPRAFYTS